jgi:hypothetical protein
MTLLVGEGLVGEGLVGAPVEAPGTPLPTRTIEMTGADGSEWDLTCGTVAAGTDPALWGTAPVLVSADERIGAPGSYVTAARHGARDLVIPLDIGTDDTASIEQNIADLARAVDAVRGDVTITVGRPDGSRRTIQARYLEGLDLISIEHRRRRRTPAALSLRAHWPYWSAATPEVVTVTPDSWGDGPAIDFNDDETAFNAPVGFNGAASEAVAFTATNAGDVTAYPTWTITGECGRVSAVNFDTGQRWRLYDGVADGEIVTITTRPGNASVRTAAGTSALGQLAEGDALWTLPAGDSLIGLQFEDGGPGSSFSMSWTAEYLTC